MRAQTKLVTHDDYVRAASDCFLLEEMYYDDPQEYKRGYSWNN